MEGCLLGNVQMKQFWCFTGSFLVPQILSISAYIGSFPKKSEKFGTGLIYVESNDLQFAGITGLLPSSMALSLFQQYIPGDMNYFQISMCKFGAIFLVQKVSF